MTSSPSPSPDAGTSQIHLMPFGPDAHGSRSGSQLDRADLTTEEGTTYPMRPILHSRISDGHSLSHNPVVVRSSVFSASSSVAGSTPNSLNPAIAARHADQSRATAGVDTTFSQLPSPLDTEPRIQLQSPNRSRSPRIVDPAIRQRSLPPVPRTSSMPILASVPPGPYIPPDGWIPSLGEDHYIHLPPPHALQRPPPVGYPGYAARRPSYPYIPVYNRNSRPVPVPIQPSTSRMEHRIRTAPPRVSSWNSMPFSLMSYTDTMLSLPEQYRQHGGSLHSLLYSDPHAASNWGIGPRTYSPEPYMESSDSHPAPHGHEAVDPMDEKLTDPAGGTVYPHVYTPNPSLGMVHEETRSIASNGDNADTAEDERETTHQTAQQDVVDRFNEASYGFRESSSHGMIDSFLQGGYPPAMISPENGLRPGDRALADYLIKAARMIKAEGTSGWAEIDTTLNKIDDQRIEHCKDDIDTLLVFAGLFSAVLTAFLIESYQTLSPDPVVQLLFQISVQTSSYKLTDSFMNSTVSGLAAMNSNPFQVAPTDLRVNILWFVSLILSLTTASFGILIKQWLREYKIVDPQNANLRARLRIRQFRYPGLVKWKVFELAALLPLLIQIALALFLSGLCIFTWSIHSGIGRTSTSLVLAWFAFFIFSAFAPSISSDCPYKIPLVAPILQPVRARVLRIWSLKWVYVGPATLSWSRTRQAGYDYVAWRWIVACWWSIVSIFSTVVLSLLCCRQAEYLGNALFLRVSSAFQKAHYPSEQEDLAPLEESAVAKDEQKDMGMLVTVDDVLLDDELLGTTMRSVIAQSGQAPQDVMDFVVDVIYHRLPQLPRASAGVFEPSDFRGLSLRAFEAVTNLTCDTITQYFHLYPPGMESPPAQDMSWLCIALSVLLSATEHRDARLLKHREQTIGIVLQDSCTNLRESLLHSSIVSRWPFRTSWTFFRAIPPPSLLRDPAVVTARIYKARYCNLCPHDSSLASALRYHSVTLDDQLSIYPVVKYLFAEYGAGNISPDSNVILAAWLEVMLAPDWARSPYTIEGPSLRLAFPVLGLFDGLSRDAIRSVLLGGVCLQFLHYLSNSDDTEVIFNTTSGRAGIGSSQGEGGLPMLYVMTHVLDAYALGTYDADPRSSGIDILHIYRQCAQMYRLPSMIHNRLAWTEALHSLASALRHFYHAIGTPSGRSGLSERAYEHLVDARFIWDNSELELDGYGYPDLRAAIMEMIEALHWFVVRQHADDRGRATGEHLPGMHCLRSQTVALEEAHFGLDTKTILRDHGLEDSGAGGGQPAQTFPVLGQYVRIPSARRNAIRR